MFPTTMTFAARMCRQVRQASANAVTTSTCPGQPICGNALPLWVCRWALGLALLFLGGCGEGLTEQAVQPSEAPVAGAPAAVEEDPDSAAQSLLAIMRTKQAMPGRPIYETVCASCHEGAVPKAPHRDMLGLMTPEVILQSLETGIMREEAAALSPEERILVTEYIAGAKMGEVAAADLPACAEDLPPLDFSGGPAFVNWGIQPTNSRYIEEDAAGLAPEQLASLKPRWAVRFPGANRARSQPNFAGGALFTGSHNGKVYALDMDSGCVRWSYQASAEVRTGIVIGTVGGASAPALSTAASATASPSSSPSTDAGDAPTSGPASTPAGAQTADSGSRLFTAFFGDVLGNVYALDAATGAEVWRERADDHPNATITGTPSLHEGRLYVPVSSLEVALPVDPYYECCTFRGSVVAYAAANGKRIWKTHTIDQPATVQSQNRAGANMRGPSGAVIWNSPAIDAMRNQLYVGTGENMSSPATLTSDAMFAMSLDDGEVNWVYQATANDVWNSACDTENDHSCPPEGGPDFDFGAATMLLTTSEGQDLVIGGQKSGFVHALNPDDGSLIWQTRVGRGGVQGGVHFGMAAAGDRLFVPISDMPDGREYDHPTKPGLHALDIRTGELLWYAPNPDVCQGRTYCYPGISQAVTVAGQVVYAGAMDGVLRAHDTTTGKLLWEIDSTAQFSTVNGDTTKGGAFGGAAGPIVHQGNLVLASGYGLYNHMPGNLLLVLAPTSG